MVSHSRNRLRNKSSWTHRDDIGSSNRIGPARRNHPSSMRDLISMTNIWLGTFIRSHDFVSSLRFARPGNKGCGAIYGKMECRSHHDPQRMLPFEPLACLLACMLACMHGYLIIYSETQANDQVNVNRFPRVPSVSRVPGSPR